MPSYKLIYFNGRGRAELMRYIFAYAEVEYEDFRMERENWPSIKPTLPLRFVPALEVDGKKLCQTKTIARYLAREFDLDGKTSMDKAIADMVVDYFFDDILKVVMEFYFEKDEEKKATAKKKFYEEQLPEFLGNLEQVLNDNTTGSGYFAGDSLTWADLGLAQLADMLNYKEHDIFAKFEKLNALHKRVVEHPRIAAWIAKRPVTAM